MNLFRRIASAATQLTLSNAVVRLLSLVTMPVLTRLLTPEAYGIAAIAGTFIGLVSVIALAGMDMSYIRAFKANSPPSGQAVEVFAWRFVLATSLLSGIILMVCWGSISDFFELPGYLGALLGAGVILSLANAMAKTRARLNSRYRAMSVAIVVSGFGAAAICIALAYWWRQDELPLILSSVAGYLILVLILGIPPIAQLREPSGLAKKDRTSVIMIGLAGTITAPAYWVLSSSDRWFLGYFEDTASVGIYNIGYTIAITGMMFNTALISVWTPEAVAEFENNPGHAHTQLGRIAERLIAGYACVWLAITAAGGDVIRLLAAPVFHDAASLVPYIAGGVFFYGLSQLANTSLLLMKRLDYAMWCWLASGVICIALNFLLVPSFGRGGAALTQTVSFGLIAIGMFIGAQKFYPLYLNWGRLVPVLVGTTVTGIVMSPAWANAPVISLLLKLPIGALAVAIITRIIAPDVFLWVTRRITMPMRGG